MSGRDRTSCHDPANPQWFHIFIRVNLRLNSLKVLNGKTKSMPRIESPLLSSELFVILFDVFADLRPEQR
jgi:hypothetical protein